VTLVALSVVRERTMGLFELFRVSPMSTIDLVAGKFVAFGLLAAVIAATTLSLLVAFFMVPMLAPPGQVATVLLLTIAASLGLGLVLAAFSSSERQVVQLSLLVLLASIFFSGFVLAVAEFIPPVQVAAYFLPVTSGIRLLSDLMLRGSTTVPGLTSVLMALTVVFVAIAWLVLRRSMRRV
jgi:ABC-2 type transport system permease protein